MCISCLLAAGKTDMDHIRSVLYKFTRYLEIIISIAVISAILIFIKVLFIKLVNLYLGPFTENEFINLLTIALNILVGIEFVKMIINYNVDTVIEVLLFAIARQLIVGHTTMKENFIGILSIVLLFAIRKYFFVPKLDDNKKISK